MATDRPLTSKEYEQFKEDIATIKEAEARIELRDLLITQMERLEQNAIEIKCLESVNQSLRSCVEVQRLHIADLQKKLMEAK